MAVKLYMDHNVPRAITQALRLRHIDVLTAFEDGQSTTDDAALLQRATALNRVLFTMDDDLLIEAVQCQINGTRFNGVVYAHQMRISIGTCVEQLELLSKASKLDEMSNTVLYLPM